MATVVQLASRQPVERAERPEGPLGEVVIFPGVRRERHDMDLAARVTDAAGKGAFGRFGSPAG